MSLELLLGPELSAHAAAGCNVFAISAPGPYVPKIAARGATHVALPTLTRAWNPAADLRAARDLSRVVVDLGLDVLHTHTPKGGVLGRVVGRLRGVPVIVNTCHGLWAQRGDRALKQALVLAAEGLAGRFSDAELYQNDEDRRRLSALVGAHKQQTVGNGVDLERFRFDQAARVRVRAELGVDDDDVLVGGVGRRVAEKGIAEFAAAARALAGRARFVWVGPDDPDKPDRLRSQEHGVEFLGQRDDMPAVFSALDVFALPSHREGFSRSAMEAAACGCALVLSDIRGCREVGLHGEELLLVARGDVQELTDAVARLVDDAHTRQRLAAAATRRAQAAFDQRCVAQASLRAYRMAGARKGLGWADAEISL